MHGLRVRAAHVEAVGGSIHTDLVTFFAFLDAMLNVRAPGLFDMLGHEIPL